MNAKEFTTIFRQSFNPEKYNLLKTNNTRKAFEYYFVLILFATLIFGLISIVRLNHVSNFVDESFAKFEKFKVSFDVSTSEPITISKFPLIVLDLSDEEPVSNDEYALITKANLYLKKFKPSISKFSLFEIEKIPLEKYSDMLENKNMFKTVFGVFFIIFLPSLFLILYFYNLIKYLLIILLFSLIALALVKFRQFDVKKRVILRTALFSSTILIIFELFISPFIKSALLPKFVYLIFFGICLFMISDKNIEFKSNDKKEAKVKYEKETKKDSNNSGYDVFESSK